MDARTEEYIKQFLNDTKKLRHDSSSEVVVSYFKLLSDYWHIIKLEPEIKATAIKKLRITYPPPHLLHQLGMA